MRLVMWNRDIHVVGDWNNEFYWVWNGEQRFSLGLK